MMINKDGAATKLVIFHLVAIAAAGAIATAVQLRSRRNRRLKRSDAMPIPTIVFSDSGRVAEIETFSHYVARQLGFSDMNECPQLCKLANNYLRKTKGCEEDIFGFLSKDSNPEALYVKLIQELDRCILAYFAFHWQHASLMVTQVLNVDSEHKKKLKNMVMEATRKQRFERITKNLKVTRVFSTLVEELRAIGITPRDDVNKCTEVMVPAALSDRSPVLLLMGGGMGAGKSTVLKDILKEAFWSGAAANAVVVEADAFKETDVIYRALNSRGHHNDMLQTAELVHQSSTDAASSLLVTALNEGRDVIMDGTLSWEPFVEQTIAMVRAIHRRRYRMGVGYKVADDGSVIENYWEPAEEENNDENNKRRPYRIELVGVVCDAYLAVVRGIRRAILMGRAVRVKSQLKSHKRFANAFPRYCQLVDHARLYSSNSMGTAPKLIAWKDGDSSLLIEPQEYTCLENVAKLNEDADSVHEVYPQTDTDCTSGSIWNDMISPLRISSQQELKIAIQMIENHVP
ncbi:P-loop containing nucleoside triphosphate hydrolase protein [Dioscorea alata]|uniref:P-loop containing nucleoside triphosphate hydrolase protein n=3 Tax=Dioscorea alata TaxID=55571 RepID=A0ACB7ULN0_DIOAL|nr:P-loop containing nucleoside triphosphate hydrolase protein [Dioscorea alata]